MELDKAENQRHEWDIETKWRHLREITTRIAPKLCGTNTINTNTKVTKLWNIEITSKVREKRRAWKKYMITKIKEDRNKYTHRKNEYGRNKNKRSKTKKLDKIC